MCPTLLNLQLYYLESTISCHSIREQIAQSSYLIAYQNNELTPNSGNIERKVTQQLYSSAGLVQIRSYNKYRQKITINIPCYRQVEGLLLASKRLKIIIVVYNQIDAVAAFIKTNVYNNRIQSQSLCSNPKFLQVSSCLRKSAEEKSDTAARQASSANL